MSNTFFALALCLLGITVNSLNLASGAPVDVALSDICKVVPANTKILQPNSCTDWAECNYDGTIIDEGSCLDGWYFDRNAARCNRSSKVDCPYASLTSSTPCSAVKSGTYLSHPDQCNGFIYCSEGVEKYSECPQGLNFEPVSQSCVYPDVYTCPSADAKDSALHTICMSVGDSIRMADPNSCTSFRQCSKGMLKTTLCIPGSYFSRQMGKCGDLEDSGCTLPDPTTPEPSSKVCGYDDDPIVGFVSDGGSCSGYYYCDEMKDGKADRNPVFGKCADGKFFDVNLFSCKDRTNVRCLFDRCEGMGNKFANLQGNCSRYSYCHDGVTTTEGSCPENYYFDEKAQSCTKEFVAFMACVD